MTTRAARWRGRSSSWPRRLKLACIAEGIEAGAQADVLHDLGCGMGQGFHFARPMASDAMTALIAEPSGAGRMFAMPSTQI